MTLSASAVVASLVLAAAAHPGWATSDLSGRVLFSGLAVPGATVIASRDGRDMVTVSDDDGAFRFANLDDGPWAIRVEMRGFVSVSRDLTLPFPEPVAWTLTMQRYEDIVGQSPATAGRRTVAVSDATLPSEDEPPPDLADVINGSMNNGAATPFAQPRSFGNNRPRAGALYTGALSAIIGNSAWNARPFSFGGSGLPAPSYGDAQLGFTLSGPLRIPWLVRKGPQTVIGYQHGVVHNATTQSARMPAAAERAGDFSQSQLAVRDPITGTRFPDNIIPAERISPQANALLALYPLPNVATTGGANYQKAVLTSTTQDQLQFATSKAVTNRTTISGTFAFQRTITDAVTLFDFTDTSRQSSLDGAISWARRFNPRL